MGNVFGKDRANGQGAMGFSETVEEIDKETENVEQNEFDPFDPLDELNANPSISVTNTPTPQVGKRGKKRVRSEDPLIDILTHTVKEFGSIQAAAGENIRRLADCFQFEADGAARRMKVFEELKKVAGLTNNQRVKVGQLLVQNQANTDYFFTLDEEFKLGFLMDLLG